jgi:hypothetical protein
MDVRHVNPVRSSGSATELSVTDGPDLGGAAMHHVYAQSEAESVFVFAGTWLRSSQPDFAPRLRDIGS